MRVMSKLSQFPRLSAVLAVLVLVGCGGDDDGGGGGGAAADSAPQTLRVEKGPAPRIFAAPPAGVEPAT